MGVYLPTHTSTELSGQTKESAHPRGSKGYVERKAHAEIVGRLGRPKCERVVGTIVCRIGARRVAVTLRM